MSSSPTPNDTWLILTISLIISVLLIAFFIKLLKGLFILLLLLLIVPVVYALVKAAFRNVRSDERPHKLKERY